MGEREGMIERRASAGGEVWKWITTALFGVVMLLVGALLGDVSASWRYSGLSSAIEDHEETIGHPVMIERVDEMKTALGRIEEKLQRQSVVLREIEHSVASVVNENKQ